MPRRVPIIILSVLCLFICPDAGGQSLLDSSEYADIITLRHHLERMPDDVDALVEVCTLLTMEGDYASLEPYVLKLFEIGRSRGNEKALLYGPMFRGHILSKGLKEDAIDSVYHYYSQAIHYGEKLKDYKGLSSTYNGMGIYAVDIEMDYYKGMNYFMQALDYARSSPWEYSYPIVVYNIALTYYQRNDPAGLEYAEEVYDMALERKNDFLTYMGAFVSSYMHYLTGNYSKALEYIRIAMDDGARYISSSEAYSHHANILAALGEDQKAEDYYRMAMEHIGRSNHDSDVMAYLSYGTFLVSRGDNRAAIPLLKKGEELARRINNGVYHYKLSRQLSQAYRNMGDYRSALEYYENFQIESDSIFNVERERSINDLRIRYESARKENELQQKDLIIVRSQKRIQLMLMTLAVTLTIAIAAILLYRRKDKMYRRIVIRQQDFLRQEKKLESMRLKQNEENPAPKSKSFGGPEQKIAELYDELESLMQKECIYREKELTRDKLAQRLGTNRTYLSRVLNEQAGQTFYNYINSYRVNEALRILSDTTSEIPLKALADNLGYSNVSAFHNSFESMIGISPAKYRKKVLELGTSVAKP